MENSMDGGGDPPIKKKTADSLSVGKYKSVAAPATTDASPNYTKTADPDTYMGKHGAPIKRSEYEASLKDPKNNMKFNSFEGYADYVGGWARPVSQPGTTPPSVAKKATAPTLDLSDKAKGLSSNYYRANQ